MSELRDPRMVSFERRPRISRFWVAFGLVALVILLASTIPSPYAVERPGPVVDAFGTIETEAGDDVPVVSVEGAQTYPTSGALNILSVSISGTPERPVDWLTIAGALFDPTRSIVPVSSVFPEGMTSEERTKRNAAMMEASQNAATVAALEALDRPVDVTLEVAEVVANGPAAGRLEVGDVILRANGVEVADLPELREVIGAVPQGDAVSLVIERDGDRRQVSLTPTTASDGSRVIGISVRESFTFDFDIDLELDTIGGPSAGLIFTLAIYDVLTPGALTGGIDVSGTGTIDSAGRVGPIGGLTQKLWGASRAGTSLMLMPLDNCADLPSRLPDGMSVVPVATLDEALDAIEAAAAGRETAGVERCRVSAAQPHG